ncbi:hypothetical protein CRG98_004552 [Punica granatum]|uniref:Uncharacterized protein n=1 Tax=Punica granatum TaxID=22663 RepID=A0A2I0L307_PUNGR|nr:hypothetical protein CRG98_004552 [Punica granatum]
MVTRLGVVPLNLKGMNSLFVTAAHKGFSVVPLLCPNFFLGRPKKSFRPSELDSFVSRVCKGEGFEGFDLRVRCVPSLSRSCVCCSPFCRGDRGCPGMSVERRCPGLRGLRRTPFPTVSCRSRGGCPYEDRRRASTPEVCAWVRWRHARTTRKDALGCAGGCAQLREETCALDHAMTLGCAGLVRRKDSSGKQADSMDCSSKAGWRMAWSSCRMHGFSPTWIVLRKDGGPRLKGVNSLKSSGILFKA